MIPVVSENPAGTTLVRTMIRRVALEWPTMSSHMCDPTVEASMAKYDLSDALALSHSRGPQLFA